MRTARQVGRHSGAVDATAAPVKVTAGTSASRSRPRGGHTLLVVGAILELLVLTAALGLRRTLRGLLAPGPEVPA